MNSGCNRSPDIEALGPVRVLRATILMTASVLSKTNAFSALTTLPAFALGLVAGID